uniref:Uncharacterized protein n=1 Tax=Lepeophtheirus salmonis TaxID=72036 RepID=A0A0K2T608_LEPSM
MKLNPRAIGKPRAPTSGSKVAAVVISVVVGATGIACDRAEVGRMTHFRDRSALFGSDHVAGAPPSWGKANYAFKFNEDDRFFRFFK